MCGCDSVAPLILLWHPIHKPKTLRKGKDFLSFLQPKGMKLTEICPLTLSALLSSSHSFSTSDSLVPSSPNFRRDATPLNRFHRPICLQSAQSSIHLKQEKKKIYILGTASHVLCPETLTSHLNNSHLAGQICLLCFTFSLSSYLPPLFFSLQHSCILKGTLTDISSKGKLTRSQETDGVNTR